MKPSSGTRFAGGIAYAYHAAPDGADAALPVVLIHGAGGDRYHWPAQVRRRSGGAVYAVDLPGHGESPALADAPVTVAAYAAALERWRAAVGLGPVLAAGHSLGGAVALEWALAAAAVRGVLLVASAARLPVSPELLRLSADPATLPEAVAFLVRYSFGPQAEPRRVALAAGRLAEAAASLHPDLAACAAFDRRAAVAGLTIPLLALGGDADRMTPPALLAELTALQPAAQVTILAGVGHMLPLEQPQAVAQALRALAAHAH
jgi:pimeloyl-ACP methyl ester carboxylesterase